LINLNNPLTHCFDSLGGDLTPYARKIHGSFNLPPGYRLEFVPREATFTEPITEESITSSGATSISCNYNSVKILIALGQAIYSITTLYRAQGDQIGEFGYAAFGLTVAPYAVISVLNLIGSLVCPEYPSLYLVESTIMQEASRRGPEYFFDGTVGKLDEDYIKGNSELESNNETPQWLPETAKVVLDPLGHLRLDVEPINEPSISIRGAGRNQSSSCATAKYAADRHGMKILPQGQRLEPESGSSSSLVLVPSSNPTKQANFQRNYQRFQILDVSRWKYWKLTMQHDAKAFVNEQHLGDGDAWCLCIMLNFIPIAIIGGLSHFDKGRSTTSERGWTMAWFSCGMLFGPLLSDIAFLDTVQTYSPESAWWISRDPRFIVKIVLYILLYAAPAIGGFVVVGQMLNSYGTCISVS